MIAALAVTAVWVPPAAALVASDVAASAGLDYRGTRNGASQGDSAVFDYDGDGDFDLVISAHGAAIGWPFMRNNGDGTFTEILQGMFKQQDRHGCVAGDFGSLVGDKRADGRPDLYCTVGACQGQCTKEYPKELYIQRTDGTFAEVAGTWGARDPHGRGRDVVAFDRNNDRKLDLAVANEGPSIFPTPNRLFRNQGGSFIDANDPVVTREKQSECAASGDIDGDGRQELMFCSTLSSSARTLTYRNFKGAFKDITANTPWRTAKARDIELADLNRDGRLDLVIVEQKRLLVRLNVNGWFPTVSSSHALEEGRDVAVGDVDLDGAPDIYVVQGINDRYGDIMLLNNGSGTGWTTTPIPQTTDGDGDVANTVPNWRGTGRAAFLVTNGKWSGRGPIQLIVFQAD